MTTMTCSASSRASKVGRILSWPALGGLTAGVLAGPIGRGDDVFTPVPLIFIGINLTLLATGRLLRDTATPPCADRAHVRVARGATVVDAIVIGLAVTAQLAFWLGAHQPMWNLAAAWMLTAALTIYGPGYVLRWITRTCIPTTTTAEAAHDDGDGMVAGEGQVHP